MPYRVEAASSGRAGCKAAMQGHQDWQRRIAFGHDGHNSGESVYAVACRIALTRGPGCTTPKVIANLKNELDGNATELDGYEDLSEGFQQKIVKAFEDGKVADEDIPESARKPADDEEEEDEDGKPKKKKAAKKPRKKKDEDDDEASEGEKPAPKKRGRPKKAKAESDGGSGEEEAKPKAKKAKKAAEPSTRPSSSRRAATKKPKYEDGSDVEEAEQDLQSGEEEKEEKPKKKAGRPKKVIKSAETVEEEE